MKIHYFQRYHGKENAATANTMLLLSRLYSYSPNRFFQFLRSEFFAGRFDPEIRFDLQTRCADSVPDAIISQNSFKVVVETKLQDWFYEDQLMRHLKAFGDEKYKVLITLAPEPMDAEKLAAFEEHLRDHVQQLQKPIRHVNTTFEALADAIGEVLDDRDDEMLRILEDYREYCYTDKLIPVSDSRKYMRMQLAGTTLAFNLAENVYYDDAHRGFRAHDTLALYNKKSVRAVGKVTARITAVVKDGRIEYGREFGELTEERMHTIERAIADADRYGYDLRTEKHRYFFVEKFYETDFRKITPRAPMGSRVFDLTEILGTEQLPDTERLAEVLKNKTWT